MSTRQSCRHWSPERDYCSERGIASPRGACEGCKSMEPHGKGLGDAVEKLLDIATAGLAKKVAKAKKGDCGCKKRRAALNRLTGGGAGE